MYPSEKRAAAAARKRFILDPFSDHLIFVQVFRVSCYLYVLVTSVKRSKNKNSGISLTDIITGHLSSNLRSETKNWRLTLNFKKQGICSYMYFLKEWTVKILRNNTTFFKWMFQQILCHLQFELY